MVCFCCLCNFSLSLSLPPWSWEQKTIWLVCFFFLLDPPSEVKYKFFSSHFVQIIFIHCSLCLFCVCVCVCVCFVACHLVSAASVCCVTPFRVKIMALSQCNIKQFYTSGLVYILCVRCLISKKKQTFIMQWLVILFYWEEHFWTTVYYYYYYFLQPLQQVPDDVSFYSQYRARDDIISILDNLSKKKKYVFC